MGVEEQKYTHDEDPNQERHRQGIFTQTCSSCGYEHKILTQPDQKPEYYTEIQTYCQCGNEIKWLLPVN